MKHFVEADPTDQPYRNYSEYLAHPRFRRIRAEALRRAGYTCQVCGTARATQVHHLRYPPWGTFFEFPSNTWIGTTVDSQYAVERAEKAFRKIRAGGYEGVAWLSCEPMMERLTFSSLDMFDWLVVGGASKSTQTAEFVPPVEWTFHLWQQAQAANVPIYMKTNLFGNDSRHREYPAQIDG